MTSPAQQLELEIAESGHMDSQTDEFYQELVDYGIESLEQFESSYEGQYESEAEFVEYILNEIEIINVPHYVCIDYQKTWDHALRFDYFSVQTRAHTYEIFSSNF